MKMKLIICIVATVIVIGIAIPIILVVGNKMAQSTVDNTEISIDKMAVYQVDADTFHVQVKTTINNPGNLGGSMAKTTIKMYSEYDNGDRYMIGQVPFPALDLPGKGSASSYVDVDMPLTKELRPGLHQFIGDSLTKDTLNIILEATIDLKALGLKFKEIDLKKTLVMKGMNHLNVTVTNFTITDFTTFEYGGTTNYHNPSNFEIRMGDLRMNTSLQGNDAGVCKMDSVYIAQGLSTAPVSGYLPLGLHKQAMAMVDSHGKIADEHFGDLFGLLICTFIANGTAYSNINQALVGIDINATVYTPPTELV